MNIKVWDEYLIAEHEVIERAMAVLKEQLRKVREDRHDLVQLRRAIDFLLEFGDKIHNKKEEDYLFPIMERRGVPRDGGPLAVMLMEHDAERKLLSTMLMKLDMLAEMTGAEREQFRKEGEEYLRIRAEHIWKENDVLYPMGRKLFQERDNERLVESFSRLNTETYGRRPGKSSSKWLLKSKKPTSDAKN